MLTDSNLRSKVDTLWEKLWSGGLSNPLDAIEQFSILLFLKRLDDEENRRERQAIRKGEAFVPRIEEHLRWRTWRQYKADDMLKHVREVVFPSIKAMGTTGSSFQRYMDNAEFKIGRASLLVEACGLIDQMQIGQQNQDVQGDLYEYMLSKLSSAGRNGQFRTPRHIIRMMVRMLNPQPNERIGDLAAGTAGFLINAYEHILVQHTPPESLVEDEAGEFHNADGSLLTEEQRQFLQSPIAFRGYDNDSGMTMLRIGSMNLMLHGLENPQFFHKDTLSKDYDEPNQYDVILMNPPFKGAIEKNEVSTFLPDDSSKTELLFLHQIIRVLDSGGRCAVILPDGVLFGSSNAHVKLRKKLIEENTLHGVISMPSGVFRPYAGVSTAVLLFTKGGSTENIWFYDMNYDGFSLDDKRNPTPDLNDIPDILNAWERRYDAQFNDARAARISECQAAIEPMHKRRLELERDINRLKFEVAIANGDEHDAHQRLVAEQQQVEELNAQLNPLRAEINKLTQHFWVTKELVAANKYDLTASRYRKVEREEVFYEDPMVTTKRMLALEVTISEGIRRIQESLK